MTESGKRHFNQTARGRRLHDRQITVKSRITEYSCIFSWGLNPSNVAAVQTVAPFGLDVCNCIRTEG